MFDREHHEFARERVRAIFPSVKRTVIIETIGGASGGILGGFFGGLVGALIGALTGLLLPLGAYLFYLKQSIQVVTKKGRRTQRQLRRQLNPPGQPLAEKHKHTIRILNEAATELASIIDSSAGKPMLALATFMEWYTKFLQFVITALKSGATRDTMVGLIKDIPKNKSIETYANRVSFVASIRAAIMDIRQDNISSHFSPSGEWSEWVFVSFTIKEGDDRYPPPPKSLEMDSGGLPENVLHEPIALARLKCDEINKEGIRLRDGGSTAQERQAWIERVKKFVSVAVRPGGTNMALISILSSADTRKLVYPADVLEGANDIATIVERLNQFCVQLEDSMLSPEYSSLHDSL